MIRVTIELISARDGHREILGTADIWNNATGTKTIGNYDGVLYGKGGHVYRNGQVRRFKRQTTGAWRLLQEFLNNAIT